MALTLQDVEHVAGLARLELTHEEKVRFQEQLSAILEYAERLNQLDTSEIPPTATVLPLHSVMREDETSPSMPREAVLENAPESKQGCFLVPAVLD